MSSFDRCTSTVMSTGDHGPDCTTRERCPRVLRNTRRALLADRTEHAPLVTFRIISSPTGDQQTCWSKGVTAKSEPDCPQVVLDVSVSEVGRMFVYLTQSLKKKIKTIRTLSRISRGTQDVMNSNSEAYWRAHSNR